MAQGITGSREISASSGFVYRVNYSQTYDIATNKSTFTITSIDVKGTQWYGATFYLNGTVTVDGTNAINVSSSAGTSSVTVSSLNTWYTFSNSSGSVTVSHNADGTKSVTMAVNLNAFSVAGSTTGTATESGTSITLTTIPRASTATWSGTTLGSNMTVTISRASSSFSHTCTVTYNSQTASATTSSDTATIALPIGWSSYTPNGTSGTGTLTVDTYSGSTKIGTKSYSVTLYVPSSVIPSVSTFTATGNSLYQGMYLRGVSTVTLKASASGSYGSTIKSYSISGGGFSSSNSTATFGTFGTAGTVTFTCTVTDSRGRTASKTVSISITDYAKPTISVSRCYRCTSDGTASADGTYLNVIANYSYSSLSSKNTISGNVSYAENGSSSYTGSTALSSGSAKVVFGGNIATTKSYIVKFTCKDGVGYSAQYLYAINTSANYLITATQGKIAINGYVDKSLANGLQINGSTYPMGDINFYGGKPNTEARVRFYNENNASNTYPHNTYIYGGSPTSVNSIGVWDGQSSNGVWSYNDVDKQLQLNAPQGVVMGNGVPFVNGKTKIVLTSRYTSNDWGGGTGGGSDFFKAWVKWLCSTYSNKSETLFIGSVTPNSQAFASVYIYNTNTLNDGLPQYSFGQMMQYANGKTAISTFGTSEYTWHYHALY